MIEAEPFVNEASFLTGGGEMGARVRAHDWSASPLGAPSTWSQSLRSALLICFNMPIVSAVHWGPELRILYNDAYAPALAERHPWALGRPFHEVWAEIWDVLGPQIASVLTTGQGFSTERQLLRMNRRGRVEDTWWVYSFAPLHADDGAVAGIFVTALDETEAYVAREALRLSEARLRELNDTLETQVVERTAERDRMWDASPDLLVVLDFDGVFHRVNPAWTAILGYAPHDLIGTRVDRLVHPDDVELTETALSRAADGPLPVVENRYRHKDGSYRWISWVAAPQGAMIYATGRHVSAEKERDADLARAQEALRQSQKMEAMGSLTGGVAHDFNNLLTPIVGSLDMLQRKGLGGEREQRLIAAAVQSAERAKTLVQRLLAFARRQPLQPTAVDLAPLVRGMAELISSTTGPQIEVVVDAVEDLPPARADQNQLEMAILNLAVNARDAMPDGGAVRISVSAETVDRRHRAALPPGTYLKLSVADTGEGMDEETATRAVEPFFSTKGIGKGTGLGLSMVHGLASQLGGALSITSKRGLGTNVELWLPSSAQPGARAALAIEPPPPGAPRPSGTALLVDDEDLVRLSIADMLAELGYEVVEATSAEAALKLIEKGLDPDLLVTDHLMPGMSGADLARTLRVSRPGGKVLLVSGYAEADGVDRDLPRLTKPFRGADLAASLAALV